MAYKNWEIADFKYLSDTVPLKYLSPTFYKGIFAIKVTCPVARSTWRFAGWVNILALGSNFPGNEGLVIQQEKLNLNSPLLIQPPNSDYYRIEIDFPRWFSSAEVIIWQAEKDGISELEIDLKLNQINFQLIMDKLNNLPDILQ